MHPFCCKTKNKITVEIIAQKRTNFFNNSIINNLTNNMWKREEEKIDSLASELISSIEMSTDFMLTNQVIEFIHQDRLAT